MTVSTPQTREAVNQAGGRRVGLDVGGTKTLAVVVDGDAVVAQVRLRTQPGPDGVVAVAAEAVDRLAAQLGVPAAEFAGVGLGVPGVVDTVRGTLAQAVNLDVGAEVALAQRLCERVGLPVVLENDVNAAAVGAARLPGMAGRGLAYLSIGTGLAAGLVLDGVLHRGRHGAAGEIGHIPVERDGPVCGCGQRGCLEAVAAGSAIGRAWPADRRTSGGAAADLFRAAAGGDEQAIAVRDRVAGYLAEAVQILVLAVDVDVVVLGGGVAEVGEPLRTAVAEALGRRASGIPFLTALDMPDRVRLVPRDVPVAAVGAAHLVPAQAIS